MLMMPLLTVLIADTQETGVSSQVEHQVLAYCIWWCAGNARFPGCKKTMYHSPAAAVGQWKKPGRQGASRMWGARHAAKVKTWSLFEQGHAEQALQSFCAKSG